jgi:hypothetical protein
MLVVYHEIKKDRLESVLERGLKRTSRGEKGDDSTTARTDKLLDEHRPDHLKQAGVSRDDNLYCYLTHNQGVVDITTGEVKAATDISESPDQQLLHIKVDASRCYVSDLDLYDQIAEAVENNDTDRVNELAGAYWQRLTRLDEYDHARGFRRPEVMVTYNISPSLLEVV